MYISVSDCLKGSDHVSYFAIICCFSLLTEPETNLGNITNISGGQLHSVSSDTLSVKPAPDPQEPVLDELRKLSRNLMAIRLQMDKHFKGSETSQEWYMIGIVIDRLLFIIYIVFILVSFITIICIWIMSNWKAE